MHCLRSKILMTTRLRLVPYATQIDKVAAQWDDLRTGYFTEAVRESAIRKAYLRPVMVVADAGAGTGYMSAGLAPRV